MASLAGRPLPYHRVYFAGKIYGGSRGSDWRWNLVYRDIDDVAAGICNQAQVLAPEYFWPILPNAVLSVLDYAGPYFIGCDHGCFHGSGSHGVGANRAYFADEGVEQELYVLPDSEHDYGAEPEPPVELLRAARRKTVELCLRAIEHSDLIFAWIDDPSAYGTVAELGYAKGRGKTVWVAGPQQFEDMWLLYTMADQSTFAFQDPESALRMLLSPYLTPRVAEAPYQLG